MKGVGKFESKWRLRDDQWLAIGHAYGGLAKVGEQALLVLLERRIARNTDHPLEKVAAQRKAADAAVSFFKAMGELPKDDPAKNLLGAACNTARFRRAVTEVTRKYIAHARLEADAPPVITTAEIARSMGKIAEDFVKAFSSLGPSGQTIVATEFERFLPLDFGGGGPFGLTEQERAALASEECEDSNISPEIRIRDVAAIMSRISRYAPHVADDLADEQGVVLKDAWTQWSVT